MTATIHTGAETLRVDRKYMPLLLALKTTGAVGTDDATNDALAHLEAAGLVHKGSLHPMADAMLELVAEPALVVSVERMRLGAVAASTIWATLQGATLGTRVDGGLYELKLVATALLPFHMYQLIHLRPLPEAASFEFTIPAETMFSAEARIQEFDLAGATAVLDGAGIDCAKDAAAVLAARVASWRIHSIWSTKEGSRTAEAYGMDCGALGHVMVTIGDDEPTLTLRSASYAEVTSTVRAALPTAR